MKKPARPRTKKQVRKCSLELRDVPDSVYRLPDDGRKWRRQCGLRSTLVQYLASFANPDGTNITVGVDRMAARLEVSRRTVFVLLDELRKLGFFEDGKKLGPKGPRQRTIKVSVILRKNEQPEVQDSLGEVQDSHSCGAGLTPKPVQSCTVPYLPVKLTDKPSDRETTQGCDEQKTLITASPFPNPIPPKNYEHLRSYLRENGCDGWREAQRDSAALRSLWNAAVGGPDERESQVVAALDDGLSKRGYDDPDGVFSQALWYLQHEDGFFG